MDKERLEKLERRKEELKEILNVYSLFNRTHYAIDKYITTIQYPLNSCQNNGSKNQVSRACNLIEPIKNRLISTREELINAINELKRNNPSFVFDPNPSRFNEYKDEFDIIKNEIKEILGEITNIYVDTIEDHNADLIPNEMYLGFHTDDSDNPMPFYLSFKNNANFVFDVDTIDYDDMIERFISAFIVSLYKNFPLGSLRVLIVDPQYKYRNYYRLKNAFDSGSSEAKMQFLYYSSYDDLFKTLDNDRSLTLSKFRNGVVDYYSLHEVDETTKFTYVLCLSGLTKLINTNYSDKMSSVAELFDPRGNYFRCGIRSMCIENFSFLEKAGLANYERIKGYCQHIFKYQKGKVLKDNNAVKLLSIKEPYYDNYLEIYANEYVKRVSNKSTKDLLCEEIGFGKVRGQADEDYISIPVGKSGNTVVEIPFTCKAGSNFAATNGVIGHMVIGSSGSGKSSIVHSLIINGCMKYSPDELEFWIIDFKENMMASRYIDTGIPHITRVASNSQPDDALSILEELYGMIQKRQALFSRVKKAEGIIFDNVVNYNRFVLDGHQDKYPLLPRIILCIDEVQTVYSSSDFDVKSPITQCIGNIVDKGRALGLHLFIISQTMDKAEQLIDKFLAQGVGHISFRQTDQALKNSHFHKAIREIPEKVTSLPTGHALISLSEDTVKEIKVAHINDENPEELRLYFKQIIARYPKEARLLKIGNKSQLHLSDICTTTSSTYREHLKDVNKESFVIGENFINLQPTNVVINNEDSSSVIVLGSNRVVSSSIMASLFVSLSKSEQKIYAVDSLIELNRPFSYLLQNTKKSNVDKYSARDIDVLIKDIYFLYKQRMFERENTDEMIKFDPVFVFINGLENLLKVEQNVKLAYQEKGKASDLTSSILDSIASIKETDSHIDNGDVYLANMSRLMDAMDNASKQASNKETGFVPQDVQINVAIKELIANAWKTNIFFIVSSKDDRRLLFTDAINTTRNLIMFNNIDFESGMLSINQSYEVKATLNKIKQDEFEESLGVARIDKRNYKFKPIVYREDEFDELLTIMEE